MFHFCIEASSIFCFIKATQKYLGTLLAVLRRPKPCYCKPSTGGALPACPIPRQASVGFFPGRGGVSLGKGVEISCSVAILGGRGAASRCSSRGHVRWVSCAVLGTLCSCRSGGFQFCDSALMHPSLRWTHLMKQSVLEPATAFELQFVTTGLLRWAAGSDQRALKHKQSMSQLLRPGHQQHPSQT